MRPFQPAALAAVLVVVTGAALAAPTVSSSFDADAEGWSTQGDAPTPTFNSTGGAPGGHVCALDQAHGDTWYFAAPPAYRGDKSDYYGGTLSFNLTQSSTSAQFSQHDVILTNGSASIAYDFGSASQHPRTTWTPYVVPLSASDDNWTTLSGEAIDGASFRQILSNLTALRIRGEYVSGSDRGCLDTVHLSQGVPLARVTIHDQAVAGSAQLVTVDSATLPEGGYIGIYKTPLQSGNLSATLIGASAYFTSGETANAAIPLDDELEGSQEIVAIAHRDTNGNQIFDFATATNVDEPYRDRSGDTVAARATAQVVTPTLTAVTTSRTGTPTLPPITTSHTPTPSPTLSPVPAPTTTTSTGGTPGEDGPGFGAVLAILAILAVAWWRRH